MRLYPFYACRMRPSENKQSHLLASAPGPSDFPIAGKQVRRLFGPCGGVARQDVLASTDFNMDSDGEDLAYEARAA